MRCRRRAVFLAICNKDALPETKCRRKGDFDSDEKRYGPLGRHSGAQGALLCVVAAITCPPAPIWRPRGPLVRDSRHSSPSGVKMAPKLGFPTESRTRRTLGRQNGAWTVAGRIAGLSLYSPFAARKSVNGVRRNSYADLGILVIFLARDPAMDTVHQLV